MLSCKNRKVTKYCVNTSSRSLEAQILDLPNSKLLRINSYLPNDPQTAVLESNNLHMTLIFYIYETNYWWNIILFVLIFSQYQFLTEFLPMNNY